MSIGLKVKAGERYRPKVVCTEVGPTLQSARDECDINTIMRRAEKSGILPTIDRVGVFADVSAVGDYREALERVELAQEVFAQLPARVRAEFENEPAKFLDFMADPANEARARELGIVAQPQEGAVEAPSSPPEAGSTPS